ncbi:MAG: HAMP domain-containing sensor histidine kinase [Chloroflexota bacterium]
MSRPFPRTDILMLAGAILAAGLVALAVATLWMHIPNATSEAIGGFLGISGGLTLVLGAIVLWLINGSPQLGLRPQLTIALAGGAVVALLNVVVTAWLMFISPHDLGLLLLLLLFSLLVSFSFAAVISRALISSLRQVVGAARRLADGDLSVRVAETGRGELRELAQDFNRMAERLEAAFQRERASETARRSLVASVSHDLRSPLASLRVAAEALQDGVVTEPEDVQRYLRTMLQDVTYLSRLIDDLFELARLEGGGLVLDRTETSLRDLISDTLESMQLRAQQKGVRLHGAVEGDPLVVADGSKVQRVLDNLLDNALRHTPAGGAVELIARQREDVVTVAVRDSGEGVDTADLPHVFDRFYRRDSARGRAGGGTGLGLAIARGFVEAHGGKIWVEQAPEHGAVFAFTLPCGRS